MEGKIIAGRYRIEQEVGAGGLATVYRATDLRLDRTVAVKVLKPEWAEKLEALERFQREARAASKLTHPNIVQVFASGADDDVHFLVMEYLPEPDLKQIIAEYAPLPAGKVNEVAVQCCQALAEIHQHSLVHGDVKPQNILFTDQGIPKLSDLGIATAVGQPGPTSSGLVLGTAHYISPEQAQGRPIGPQSDLYSLGCVIYEARTGQTPFSGQTPAQVAAKHVRLQPPSPRAVNPDISPSEEYLINKLMTKDPARRYHSAHQLQADLQKLARGEELDRTGVLDSDQEATTAMPTTKERLGRPPGLREAAEPEQALADSSLIWTTVVAILLALIALVMIGWLIKKAFYPGAPPAEVQVPAVRGMTEAEARQQLSEAKLAVGRIRNTHKADKPPGEVIDQHPAEGDSVPVGTQVELTVNLGKETVTVPDLAGMLVYQAAEKLEEIGLTVGETTQRYSEQFEKDKVIRQSHAPGTVVEKGWPVELVISKGPEPAEEKPTEQPETNAAEGEPTQQHEPDVSIRSDETSISPDRMTRDYVISITVFGQKEQQHIKVIKRDDSGGPVIVLDDKMEPGRARQLRVIGRGNTTIEVYHEDELVASKSFEIEAETSNTN